VADTGYVAAPLIIPTFLDAELLHTDVVQFEVDDVALGGRLEAWPETRGRNGFGFVTPLRHPFGVAGFAAPPIAVWGAGDFGLGGRRVDWATQTQYVAGDYGVRARAIDSLGNAGDWTDSVTIEHRPTPPPPRNLAISDNVLSWTWSDP